MKFVPHRVLRRLANQAGINDPKKSVYSMRMVHVHQPRSKADLLRMLNDHTEKPECSACGLKVNGGMVRWTERIHKEARRSKRYAKAGTFMHCVNIQDCADLVYYMKVSVPYRGFQMEQKALYKLSQQLGVANGRHATQHEDTYYKVDLVFPKRFGVQVKPESYRRWCDGPAPSCALCGRASLASPYSGFTTIGTEIG